MKDCVVQACVMGNVTKISMMWHLLLYISLVHSERVIANNQFHSGNYVIIGMSILDTYLDIKLADNVYMKAMPYDSYQTCLIEILCAGLWTPLFQREGTWSSRKELSLLENLAGTCRSVQPKVRHLNFNYQLIQRENGCITTWLVPFLPIYSLLLEKHVKPD